LEDPPRTPTPRVELSNVHSISPVDCVSWFTHNIIKLPHISWPDQGERATKNVLVVRHSDFDYYDFGATNSFGFSRGAVTVRTLAGFMNKVNLWSRADGWRL
jgi:hypothetical protein